jgi:hypothetical protein
MTSIKIALGVFLTFAASAVAQSASRSIDHDTYLRCLVTQTAVIDDGRSPAETIALAVASACLREGRAMFGTSPNGAYILETHDADALRDLLARFAVKVVTRYRSSQKETLPDLRIRKPAP